MSAPRAAPNTALAVGLVSLFSVSWMLGELLLLHKTRLADGEPGLSMTDLEVSFTGANRNMLEAMVRGPMRQYLAGGDELGRILMWMEHGATQEEYAAGVGRLLEERCAGCHHAGGEAGFQQLDTYAAVHEVVLANPAPPLSRQLLVTKVHLAGIGLILGVTGYLFSRVQHGRRAALLIALAFFGLALDFGAWWLMRVSTDFAYLRVVGHSSMLGAYVWMAATILFRSLGQLFNTGTVRAVDLQ